MTDTVESVWHVSNGDWSVSPLATSFATVVETATQEYAGVHDPAVIRAVAVGCRRRLERHRRVDASAQLLHRLVANHLDAMAPTDGRSARDIRRMRRELAHARHRSDGAA